MSCSDSLDGSKRKAAHSKLLRQFKQLQLQAQQAQHEHAEKAHAQQAQHEQDQQRCTELETEATARTQEAAETQSRSDLTVRNFSL